MLKGLYFRLKRGAFFVKFRVVVIESDDWGYAAIYDPTKIDLLKKNGLIDEGSPLSRYARETEGDLDKLQETLTKFQDSFGCKPQITANFVVKEPDFEAIESGDFKKYYSKNISGDIYQKILASGTFFPQYHSLNHFNLDLLEKDLSESRRETVLAFQNRAGVAVPALVDRYIGEYADVDGDFKYKALATQEQIIRDGLASFKQIFGYHSESSIACAYFKNDDTEQAYAKFGIRYIQGDNRSHVSRLNGRFMDKNGSLGADGRVVCLHRNLDFEPLKKSKHLDDFYARLRLMLRWGWYPITISTHSINYCGRLNSTEVDFALSSFRELLLVATTARKNLLFLNSVELGKIIDGQRLMHGEKSFAIRDIGFLQTVVGVFNVCIRRTIFFVLLNGFRLKRRLMRA